MPTTETAGFLSQEYKLGESSLKVGTREQNKSLSFFFATTRVGCEGKEANSKSNLCLECPSPNPINAGKKVKRYLLVGCALLLSERQQEKCIRRWQSRMKQPQKRVRETFLATIETTTLFTLL